jgi:uncharacterized protein YihD (DUF1040 family)
MARLPRFQESGLISADIPRMDFANLREESRQSQTISQALTRISEFAFGQAQKEREQQNKLLGIQLRSDFEMESQAELAEITTQVKTGRMNMSVAQESITALAQKYGGMLGQYSPEQAAGLVNTISNQGRAILAQASDREVKLYQIEKDVEVDRALKASSVNLETRFRAATSYEEMNQAIIDSRSIFFGVARETVDPEKKMVEFSKNLKIARENFIKDFINESRDPIVAYQQLKAGRTGNAVIDGMIKSGERNDVMLAADEAMKDFNTTIDNVSKFNAERAKEVEVRWADAIRSNNPAEIRRVLSETRLYDPGNYEKRLNQYDNTGGVFASRDNQLLVKNLDERLSNPFGPNPVTAQELINNAGRLTQDSYSRYLDRIKSYSDERVKILRESVASELGMSGGSVLIPDAARKRAQAQLNALDVALISARRADPNLDVFTWYSNNKDKILKPAAQRADTDLATTVAGRSIKTEAGFKSAIRDAQKIGDLNQANTLQLQYQDWQDARKQGLIDENGNKVKAGAAQ